jgi:hypothetical protein
LAICCLFFAEVLDQINLSVNPGGEQLYIDTIEALAEDEVLQFTVSLLFFVVFRFLGEEKLNCRNVKNKLVPPPSKINSFCRCKPYRPCKPRFTDRPHKPYKLCKPNL